MKLLIWLDSCGHYAAKEFDTATEQAEALHALAESQHVYHLGVTEIQFLIESHENLYDALDQLEDDHGIVLGRCPAAEIVELQS